MANMPYKVFFVEDEIVTREGIRDNVDWAAGGFEFCGEAMDGEMALPLIQAARPEILITDIKMPFMDGLQLSKIVRERMPWIKIIILSGHDEFEYARKAIELGVTEYLLKPVTIGNLQQSLQRVSQILAQERKEQENLLQLHSQVDESLASLREKLLLKLMLGTVSSTDAIERGQALGMDLIARCYVVMIAKFQLSDRSDQFDYDEYQRVENIITELIENNPDVFILKKDWEDLVILLKGGTPETVDEEKYLLLARIREKLEKTRYKLVFGVGSPQKRIADIYHSFVEALENIQKASESGEASLNLTVDKVDLLKVDKSELENFLRSGTKDGVEQFFEGYIRPLRETAQFSQLIKNYIFLDLIVVTAKLVKEWGGDIDEVFDEMNSIETILSNIKTSQQLQEQAQAILVNALAFRDSQARNQHNRLVRQAREYIDQAYTETDLSLNEVAARVNLSPSHFSVVFAQETGQNFKDYLTGVRIQKAKELLRSTALKSTDIACLVGYNDPHYFSFVFKKNTGLSPSEFRAQGRSG
jgi:two-component system, response regulator YesN